MQNSGAASIKSPHLTETLERARREVEDARRALKALEEAERGDADAPQIIAARLALTRCSARLLDLEVIEQEVLGTR
jgi:hypothetical protein